MEYFDTCFHLDCRERVRAHPTPTALKGLAGARGFIRVTLLPIAAASTLAFQRSVPTAARAMSRLLCSFRFVVLFCWNLLEEKEERSSPFPMMEN